MFKNINAAVLLLILSTRNDYANAAAGDNENLFLDLCNLLELGKRAVSKLAPTNLGELAYSEIQKLNMSLSDDAWKAKFAPKKGKQENSNNADGAPRSQEKTHARNHAWRQAATDLAGDEGDKPTLRLAGLEAVTQVEKLQYLSALQPLAERAAAILEQLKTLHSGSAGLTDTNIRQEIQTALYGTGATAPEKTTLQLLKGKGNVGSTRKDICGQDNTAAKADTVLAYLFCICAGHATDSGGAIKVCSQTQPANNKADADVSDAHTHAAALAGQCHGSDTTNDIKAAEIDSAILEFTSKLKAANQKPYFGKYSATGCTGSDAEGICVMFKTTAKGEGKAVKQIPWVLTLHNAAEMIRKQQAVNGKIDSLNQELQAIQTAAYALKPQLEMYKRLQQTTEKARPGKQLTEMQAGECNTHKSNSTCPKNNCKWEEKDGKDGKCVADDSKVTTQGNAPAGAGDGTAGTTTTPNCASHTDKTKCEEENKGKTTPVCGWRKGKEGESDQDKEMCRNGSFLAKKKFALSVVSAAFTALLF
uniref:Variant surface glycoprotein ILTAT 1.23 n=1 Tax=Trypanosoma brucei brucei TaxID=5702 RepID=VSI3_TRYBB|nr:RecName: Full=Variant surface glycoprotein ILTAT 1.23; Short=VSG; Flags: Precursor [Trypanosoma brucei brucei]CAA40087.1 variant surface glycoprotein ILTat 1.23 [Trypanosoma brucei]